MNGLKTTYLKLAFELDDIDEQIKQLRARQKEITDDMKHLKKCIREECGNTGKTIDELED